MDADAIEKFRKVRALASGGATEGERTAARSVMQKMEQRYPGIGAAASAPPPAQPNGAFGFPPGSGFRPSGKSAPPRPPGEVEPPGFVDSVFDWLRGAAEGLREGMSLRQRLLDAVTIDSSINTRTMKISIAIPLAELEDLLEDFGDEKDIEIATILSSFVRDEYLNVVSSMAADVDDE